MKYKYLYTVVTVFVLVTGVLSVVHADPRAGCERGMMMRHMKPMGDMAFMHAGPMDFTGNPFMFAMMAEKLELTDDQRNKIGAIMDAMSPKMRDLAFRMSDSHKETRAINEENKSMSDKDIHALARKHGDLVEEMMYLHMKTRSDINAVLTPEQIEKMSGQMEERRFFSRPRWVDDDDDD